MRANMKWHTYEPNRNIGELEALVTEVEHDQYGAFFFANDERRMKVQLQTAHRT